LASDRNKADQENEEASFMKSTIDWQNSPLSQIESLLELLAHKI
jgi:hypothetical protein